MKKRPLQPMELFELDPSMQEVQIDGIENTEFTPDIHPSAERVVDEIPSSLEPEEDSEQAVFPESFTDWQNPQPNPSISRPKKTPLLPRLPKEPVRKLGIHRNESWLRWGLPVLIGILLGAGSFYILNNSKPDPVVIENSQPVQSPSISKANDPLQPDPAKSKEQRIQEAVDAVRRAIKD